MRWEKTGDINRYSGEERGGNTVSKSLQHFKSTLVNGRIAVVRMKMKKINLSNCNIYASTEITLQKFD